MDNKSDLFDLKREKQELDHFLSTIAGADAPPSAAVIETAAPREAAPVKEPQPVEKIAEPDPPKPRPLASTPGPEEAFIQPVYHEKPEPPVAESKPLKPAEEADLKPKVTSSFLPNLEEKKEEPLPKVLSVQEPKAPESRETFVSSDKAVSEVKTDILREEKTMAFGGEKEKNALEEALYEQAPTEKKSGKGKQAGLLILLVVVLLAGAIWMFSGKVMHAVKSIPVVGTAVKSLISAEKDVNLVDVRTRLVENKKIGKSVRVIEGTAVNASTHTISRIKIAAQLQDAGGAELISMESFAGNILTDDKLENLDAGAIKAALQSSKGVQEKIPPKGQVPFMIVFAGEPAGVFKMSITTTDLSKN